MSICPTTSKPCERDCGLGRECLERKEELDRYEERFGKYVEEQGPFGMMGLKIGNQGFPIHWNDDPNLSTKENADGRRWFKRMLCNALHNLVEEHTT